jgi:ERCC4-type nuclease
MKIKKWQPPTPNQAVRYYLNGLEGCPPDVKVWVQAGVGGAIAVKSSIAQCPKLEDVLLALLNSEKITDEEAKEPSLELFEMLSKSERVKVLYRERIPPFTSPVGVKPSVLVEPIELSNPVTIIIDMREPKEIVDAFKAIKGVQIERQVLPSGDFVFPGGIVERKEAGDLTQSIIDKRLFFQSDDMAAADTHVLRAVIIEGDPYAIGRLSVNALDGAISYLAVLQGLTVLSSLSVQHTANLTARMAAHAVHGLGYELSYRQAKPKAIDDQLLFVVQGLPGIGVENAKALLKHFGTLSAIFKATPKEIQQVDGFGKKTAEGIVNLINEVWCQKT